MTSNAQPGNRLLGTLRAADGKGVVRMEDRYDTDIDDLWSAITDPSRLARWYGEVEGDLRVGGVFRLRVFASGWEGSRRVEACEPPRQLLLVGKEQDEPDELVTEVTLTADGDRTILVMEERGMPLRVPGRLRGRGSDPRRGSRRLHRRARALRLQRAAWTSCSPPIRLWRPSAGSGQD